jgi:hypothetical protein
VLGLLLSDYTPMRKLATRTGMLVKPDGAETYASLELPMMVSNASIEEAVA